MPCKYCEPSRYATFADENLLEVAEDLGVYIDRGNVLVCNITDWLEREINFCPMCGDPLSE